MKVSNWLVINKNGVKTVRKSKPSLDWDEIAVKLNLEIPNELFQRAIKDAMKGGLSKLDLLALLPPGHTDQHIMVMLYDHRFNRSLWGECICGGDLTVDGPRLGIYCPVCDEGERGWQYHIQKMALSGDPLAYIAKTKYGIKVER